MLRWLSGGRVARALGAAVSILVLGGGQVVAAGHATLFVSPAGSDAASCSSAHPCRTIGHAVSVGSGGDRIVVRSGTYAESVTITKTLHLVGRHRPTIDAAGLVNGVVFSGPGSSGSSLRGFRIVNADQEGILAAQTAWVAIVRNVVAHNDQGMFASTPTGECAPVGETPATAVRGST